ncbi:hypothetical protein BU24DRAFT_166099 [Aaosphaeria arxii CBS 175.79]|uniref:Uncharacterized protein n=1 Tax=Aaosphaeria arxii CBS 175.79 TaxID=1450172 RepID=A0A6A5Y0S3_9PLEO|nr:uncharacterized protein BU24DRAFT_166099 [Aaosphaeria arxii CBS 175.79]KAF2018154.1 hypothetical protein BU24DRAFT_166099 [Aaosphaeria arxii CBS 175.79]
MRVFSGKTVISRTHARLHACMPVTQGVGLFTYVLRRCVYYYIFWGGAEAVCLGELGIGEVHVGGSRGGKALGDLEFGIGQGHEGGLFWVLAELRWIIVVGGGVCSTGRRRDADDQWIDVDAWRSDYSCAVGNVARSIQFIAMARDFLSGLYLIADVTCLMTCSSVAGM